MEIVSLSLFQCCVKIGLLMHNFYSEMRKCSSRRNANYVAHRTWQSNIMVNDKVPLFYRVHFVYLFRLTMYHALA